VLKGTLQDLRIYDRKLQQQKYRSNRFSPSFHQSVYATKADIEYPPLTRSLFQHFSLIYSFDAETLHSVIELHSEIIAVGKDKEINVQYSCLTAPLYFKNNNDKPMVNK